MDAVLGLSVTPSAVGLVLVEGQDADGATVEREAFELPRRRRSTPAETSEQAAAAVLRTEAIAAARGHRLHSIGVTWSDDADVEASLLLDSLSESGFDNVVPVRLPEATEALAWGVAEVIGHDITAVCVIEPETVIALIVHTREGAVQTAVNHRIDTEESLVRWLSAVFTRADWRPQALVVVGSGGAVDALMPRLEDVLSVPVFAPADAELALARGAALASTHAEELLFTGHGPVREDAAPPAPRRRHAREAIKRPVGATGPLAMLAVGAVTFVVSVSAAISLEITPEKDTVQPEARPAAKSTQRVAAAADSVPLAPPRPEVVGPIAEAQIAAPEAMPAGAVPSEAVPSEAPPPEAPVESDVPIEMPVDPALGVVDPAAAPVAAPAPDAVPPPAPGAPVEALPPPVPVPAPEAERPSIRQRIKDRLSGVNRVDDVPAAPPPAPMPPPEAVAPPPPEAVAPPAPPTDPPPADTPPPPPADAPPLLPPA